MKNKESNINVLMAISIGLSAALSLMPSVTAYADDDVESDTYGGEQTEETSSVESNESDENEEVKEAVSEASDAIDAAIDQAGGEEASDAGDTGAAPELEYAAEDTTPGAEEESETPGAFEAVMENADFSDTADVSAEPAADIPAQIAEDLSVAAEEMDIIGGQVAALDQANFVIEEANQDYEAAETAAAASVSYAGTKAEEADDAVGTVVQVIDEVERSAENASEAAKASETVYSDESEAAEAKSGATQAVQEVQSSIDESKTAVDKAQQKLNEADNALKVAEGALESAVKEKEDADAAAAEAKAKLISILEENGISYNEEADGSVTVDKEAEITDGHIKTAIDKAQAAADKAAEDAQNAEQALINANKAAMDAAQARADAAETNLNEKNAAYDQAAAAYSEDAELEAMLADIRVQQDKVKEVVAANKNQQDYWNANRTLAYYIAKYMLSQDENIDRSSISTKFSAAGYVQKIKDGFEVSYKEKDSDATKYAYFNYKGYYRDGDIIGAKYHDGLNDADHIIVLKKEVKETNSNGTAKSLGPETVFFSELGINNGEDSYQSAKTALADALAAKEVAASEKEAADAALAAYADLEAARTGLNEAEEKLAGAKAGFSEDDRMNELISLIGTQQEVVRGAKSTTAYWSANRVLAAYMVEYALHQQSGVDASSIEVVKDAKGDIAWVKDNGTSNHYGTVKYRLQGSDEVQTMFFDYIAYYDNGETVSQGSFTDINTSTINDSSSSLRPDHILVVQKQKSGDNTFVNKGTAFFDEADFNAQTDMYQSTRNNIAKLEQAVSDARAAVSVAENIVSLNDAATKANSLKEKVDKAKEKVENAAVALKNARITQAINADRIQKLTEELAVARTEYENAAKAYEAAEEKLGRIQSMVDEMLDSIENGFNYQEADTEAAVPETPIRHMAGIGIADNFEIDLNTSALIGGGEGAASGDIFEIEPKAETLIGGGAGETAIDNPDIEPEPEGLTGGGTVAASADNANEGQVNINQSSKTVPGADSGSAAETVASETGASTATRQTEPETTRVTGAATDTVKATQATGAATDAAKATKGAGAATDTAKATQATGAATDTAGATQVTGSAANAAEETKTAGAVAAATEETGRAGTSTAAAGTTAVTETVSGTAGETETTGSDTGSIEAATGSSTADLQSSGTASGTVEARVSQDAEEMIDGNVLGQRMAPIIEAVENGTFKRGMMFTEDGLKTPFMWWIFLVLFGAKGAQTYVKKYGKKEKEDKRT